MTTTTSASENSNHDTMKKAVKELGRKARERLQEERAKRREIVRLDDAAKDALPPPPRAAAPWQANRKRQRQELSLEAFDETNATTEPSPPPNTEATAVKLPSSSLVGLSGFPNSQTTVAHVRRFLSGLDVLQIWIPISPNIQVRDNNRRYESTWTTTLWVRLGSPAIAALAVQRSGESITIEQQEFSIEARAMPLNFWDKMQTVLMDVTMQRGSCMEELRQNIVQRDVHHPAVAPVLLRNFCHCIGHDKKLKRIIRMKNDESVDAKSIPGLEDGDLVPNDKKNRDQSKKSMERIVALRDVLYYQLPWVDHQQDQWPGAKLVAAAIQVLEDTAERWKIVELRQHRSQGW